MFISRYQLLFLYNLLGLYAHIAVLFLLFFCYVYEAAVFLFIFYTLSKQKNEFVLHSFLLAADFFFQKHISRNTSRTSISMNLGY